MRLNREGRRKEVAGGAISRGTERGATRSQPEANVAKPQVSSSSVRSPATPEPGHGVGLRGCRR